ncbi:MAG: uridine kinase family protein [Pseudonocardiaceae bacterium]
MSYYSDDALQPLIELVDRASKNPLLLGIDGQGGSGKSTLARELVGKFDRPAAVVEGDDFYRDMPDDERLKLGPAEGFEWYFDWQRLKEQVLVPVREGKQSLRYQRYDWDNARMGVWVDIPMPSIVIVDGIYTLRPALRHLSDVKVYVEASKEVRVERQIDRAENPNEWIKRWIAAEDFYVAEHDPRGEADVVVDGS